MPRKTKEQKELENENKIEKKAKKSTTEKKKVATSTTKKTATKTPAKKTTATKSTTKKVATTKSTPKEATTKKATATKTTPRKTTKKASTTKSNSEKVATKTATKKSPAKKEVAPKTATKKSTAKKEAAPKTTTKKSTAKKEAAPKTATKKSTAKKEAAPKTTTKKSTAKKVDSTKTVTTKGTSKKTTTRKNTSSKKKVDIVEYYDLPYRYNQTIVKVLAQTPTNLFIYWDISDKDRKNFEKQYGDKFFETTRPILIIHNDTLGYRFEVAINDFANSWYLHVADSKCDYRIELGRRPITKTETLNTDYIYITTSNEIESPNDRILFDKNQQMVYFRDTKTGKQTEKQISSISLIRNMGKIYNIYDLYQAIYPNENIEEIFDLSNPSSGNPSSGSLSSSRLNRN